MDRLGAGAHLVLAGLSVALLWHSEGLKFTQMWTIMPLELEIWFPKPFIPVSTQMPFG